MALVIAFTKHIDTPAGTVTLDADGKVVFKDMSEGLQAVIEDGVENEDGEFLSPEDGQKFLEALPFAFDSYSVRAAVQEGETAQEDTADTTGEAEEPAVLSDPTFQSLLDVLTDEDVTLDNEALIADPPEVAHLARQGVVLDGRTYWRAPTLLERRILSLAEIPDTLDTMADDLNQEVVSVRVGQLRGLTQRIVQKDARDSTAAFTDFRPDVTDVPLRRELGRALRQAQIKAAAFGALQLRLELHRQGMSLPVHLAHSVVDEAYGTFLLDEASASSRTAQSAMVSSARLAAEKLSDAWFARIMETGLRLRRTGLQGQALQDGILSTLEKESRSGANRDCRAEINEAFQLGRHVEIKQWFPVQLAATTEDEIDYCVYSAILDRNTCDPCERLDGEEVEYGSDRMIEIEPPNKDCKGGDNCRCTLLYIMKDRADRVKPVPADDRVPATPEQLPLDIDQIDETSDIGDDTES